MELYRTGENNHNFKTLLNNGGDSDNPVWQKVLDGLRSGHSEWKVVPKEIKACRHPGVRDKGNRCVFCLIEKHDSAQKRMNQSVESAREDHLKQLYERAAEFDMQAAMMRVEAMEIESGKREWPPQGVSALSRQEAIAQGKKWYLPMTPCKHCGVTAEKYVPNGRCRNCGK